MSIGRFRTVAIDKRDRVLVVAPHPDDELISAGLLMQRALVEGARVRVVIVTHGDAFGYTAPPRAAGRAPRVRRIRLGIRRAEESLRALARIGVPPTAVTFLGYPDRGLAQLWSNHWKRIDPYHSAYTSVDASPYDGVLTPDASYAGEQLFNDLVQILEHERPTMLVFPHPKDAHYDHTACSAFVTGALEYLIGRGRHWVKDCQRFVYLVHRGGWPSPRGLNPSRVHRPPQNPAFYQEQWEQIWAGPRRVAQKQAAILMYRSQFPLIGRFLLSFVGKNEVFSRPSYPHLHRVENSSICIGGDFSPWPSEPVLLDPIQDTLTRQVERSADISAVRATQDDAFLFVQMGFARRPVPEVDYRLSFYPGAGGEGLHLSLRPPGRVGRKVKGIWHHQKDIVLRCRQNYLEVAIPGRLVGENVFPTPERDSGGFFVSLSTHYRGIAVDRTGFHFIRARPMSWQDDGVVYAVATPDNLAECALIFVDSFTEHFHRVLGTVPSYHTMRDVFRLCYQVEPGALIVALLRGRVIGYVFAPTSVERIWRKAVGQGLVPVRLRQWIRRRSHGGLTPWRLLLLDKFQFLRPPAEGEQFTESRVISMAVTPGARLQGVGIGLLKHALNRFRFQGVKSVRLEVRSWNEPAIRTCRKLGFTIVSTSRDKLGEWVIMRVSL